MGMGSEILFIFRTNVNRKIGRKNIGQSHHVHKHRVAGTDWQSLSTNKSIQYLLSILTIYTLLNKGVYGCEQYSKGCKLGVWISYFISKNLFT